LAEAQNLAVLVIIKTEDGFEERSSSALDVYMDASVNESANNSSINAIDKADET
jgi:hypothetical protein